MNRYQRQSTPQNKIALLATGDEICHGDILNSNAQEISQSLFALGMSVGMHMSVMDDMTDIEAAIRFLLQNHKAIIITGGLGPTSDDLTRYALANAINRELIFDEKTWEAISTRIKKLGYATPPESNRRQAFFPQGAVIIPNPNGTAAGCMLAHDDQLIFMLPGPPLECLPLFKESVLPTLKTAQFSQPFYYKKWLLFGASEGQIAEELDELVKEYSCTTGYRLWYPYLEFKLRSQNLADFNILVPQIEKTVAPYIIDSGAQTASAILKETLLTLSSPLAIHDLATGGLLENIVKTPLTRSFLHFSSEVDHFPLHIKVTGLKEFWEGQKETVNTTLEIIFTRENKQTSINAILPFRNDRIKEYAVELICRHILSILR